MSELGSTLYLRGHAKERPSASEEVVARPRNILARPRTFLALQSPIQVNPSYFSSFERRLMRLFERAQGLFKHA